MSRYRGFSIIGLFFWLALIGFVVVGFILKDFRGWEKKTDTTDASKLTKSKNVMERTAGDQKLKKDLLNDTP